MMKKILLLLFIISSFNSKGTIHKIGVWGGYYEFVPASITIQLGDTLQWEPFAGLLPMMLHTITSDNIPSGAAPFDQVWQMPADTFFQYIPQVAGLYQYVCTPHIPNGMIGEFTVINGTTAINEHTSNKELIKVINILGRETKGTKNEPLFYIYDDGTVEKKIIIE
jgi:plastocyanin